MISRQAIISGYKISKFKFAQLLQQLPKAKRKKLNLKLQRYLKPYQVNIIVENFGDYENGRFMDKGRFARMYGTNAKGMRQIIIDEFGESSKLLHKRKYFTPKEQQTIIDKIGKW